MTDDFGGRRIHVSGIVQGVGFRPFVYNLATRLSLRGWVGNSSSGVDIDLAGSDDALNEFCQILQSDPPPLCRIDDFKIEVKTAELYTDFVIRESQFIEGESLPISPDVSICTDCAEELFNPSDRRYRYPFINCTNCGPRFTIISDIPYDRPNTTMRTFPLCTECARECHDPLNRRFHAQPVACPRCGPTLKFYDQISTVFEEDALQAARKAIADGKIVAIKGLGGFHLACDASNQLAVKTLRARKKRSDKPFALMAFDIQSIRRYVEVSDEEVIHLESRQHPVVLLRKKTVSQLAEECAPSQNHLGFMLPYTPLHLLLMEPASGFPEILVMTSGNLSEEPIAFEDEDADLRLGAIADAFLTNNRPIQTRIDDSVIRVFNHNLYPIRRARGYVPDPIPSPLSLPGILACGAELKNTFSISRDSYIFLSHHIGDLENYETLQSFEQGIAYYQHIFRLSPEAIAVDLHPDYLSTRYGIQEALDRNVPALTIQHHHAHLASCLADNRWQFPDPVIGLIFDGTGYGLDGNIWGGEILLGGYSSFDRRFHLEEMQLPGGDSAIRSPAKIALAYLLSTNFEWEEDLLPVRAFCEYDRTLIRSQLSHHINTPLTTSMGRLFDAVSALAGIRQTATYEGQAAIELENCCDTAESSAYTFPIDGQFIRLSPLFDQILDDLHHDISQAIISARFHNGIARTCLDCALQLRAETGVNTVALSGGVWQNMTLLEKTTSSLTANGFICLVHKQVPTNDGGISIGQIMVAADYLRNDMR